MLSLFYTIVNELFAYFFPSNLPLPSNLDLVHLAIIGSYSMPDNVDVTGRRLARVRAHMRAQARARSSSFYGSGVQCKPSRRQPPAANDLSVEILRLVLLHLSPSCPINLLAAEERLDADDSGYDRLGDGWQERLLYTNIPCPQKLPTLRNLARALRVCQKWYISGIDLLWRMPRFPSLSSFMKFQRFLLSQMENAEANRPSKRVKQNNQASSKRSLVANRRYGSFGYEKVRIFDIAHWHNTPELSHMLSSTDFQFLPSIMSHLSVLSFAGLDKLTETTLAICLSSIRSRPGLLRLDLSGCINVTDASLSLIALLHGKSLRWLSLKGCARITDRGLYTLIGSVLPAASSDNKNHKNNSNIDTKTSTANIEDTFDSNIGCLKLRHLNISHCFRVTEKGIFKVVSRLNLRSLQMVNCLAMDQQHLPHILEEAGKELEHIACNLPSQVELIRHLFGQLFQLSELRHLLLDHPIVDQQSGLFINRQREYHQLVLELPEFCPKLVSLELYNRIEVRTADVFAGWLSQLPQLQLLRLCKSPNLSVECIKVLSKVCGNRLFLLDISCLSPSTHNGFNHLAMPALRGLIAHNLVISQTNVSKLLARCPELRGLDITGYVAMPEDRLMQLNAPTITQMARIEAGPPFQTSFITYRNWCRIGEEGCELSRLWASMDTKTVTIVTDL
ncbi:hypothetical protein BDF19DRAFT_444251 [Syncephalis fuscata]|nr:hypothetical protein BDF19DRAFT_444251 [Syncephalis fuscata]